MDQLLYLVRSGRGTVKSFYMEERATHTALAAKRKCEWELRQLQLVQIEEEQQELEQELEVLNVLIKSHFDDFVGEGFVCFGEILAPWAAPLGAWP